MSRGVKGRCGGGEVGAEGAERVIVVASGNSVWFVDSGCTRGCPIGACSDFHDRFDGVP